MSPTKRRVRLALAWGASAAAWFGTATAQPAESADAAPGGQACIAVVLPSAQGVAGNAGDFSKSLRDLMVSYLNGPSLRTVSIDAKLASQAVEEARQQGCANVLLTSVTRKQDQGGGWLGKALQHAAPATAHALPYGNGVGQAMARGAAVGGAYAVSSMAQTSKAKDQVTLEYRIGSAESVMQAAPQKQSAKAKTDGEDLLTPLVEKAAESIAASVLGK